MRRAIAAEVLSHCAAVEVVIAGHRPEALRTAAEQLRRLGFEAEAECPGTGSMPVLWCRGGVRPMARLRKLAFAVAELLDGPADISIAVHDDKDAALISGELAALGVTNGLACDAEGLALLCHANAGAAARVREEWGDVT